jgi:molybdenum cofactor cytidylyltransferase
MVRHAVRAAQAAGVAEIIVVTGHMRAEIEAALAGLPVRCVANPDYAAGLSTSLKAGIAALSPAIDAAIVMLGDMPRIGPTHLRRLMAAFDPAAGRSIVVPTWQGKRGNPVVWGRAHFAAFRALEGDVGARHLLGEPDGQLVEVPMEDAAIQLDIDTPEALAALESDAP